MDQGDKGKLVGGGVLIAVAVVIVILIASGGGSGSGGTGTGDVPDEGTLACTLAASGVGLVAAGLSRGESAAAIAATVGGPAVIGYGCNQMIKTFVAQPTEPVQVGIQTPQGVVRESPTGTQLAQPPPPTAPSGRAVDCLGWNSLFLYRMCINGTLGLPSS